MAYVQGMRDDQLSAIYTTLYSQETPEAAAGWQSRAFKGQHKSIFCEETILDYFLASDLVVRVCYEFLDALKATAA